MRLIRLLFVVLLGLVLVGLAVANRGPVTVNLLPGSVANWLGGRWSVEAPVFLVILLALLAGVVGGMLWEWLREAAMRGESAARAHRLAELERETGDLRQTFSAPRDDVLAIIDAPRAASKAGPAPTAGGAPALAPAAHRAGQPPVPATR